MTAPTPDALREAARASVQIKPDPQTGVRPGDPLYEVIPNGRTPLELLSTRAAVERVTGERVPLIGSPIANTAELRSELRRWAMREGWSTR